MRAVSRQEGFGLVELLVAMALSVIVFGLTLTVLDIYMRQSNAATQRFDAQNKARLAVDRIARQLRNVASPLAVPKLLERATPDDIVFQTIGSASGANASGTERVRYCIPQDTSTGSAANEELITQTQTWTTAAPPADPWSTDPTVTIPCPDATFAQQPNGIVLAQSVVNRYQQMTTRPAFAFNDGLDNNSVTPADLPQISTIQISLWVNPTPKLAGATTQIQSSVYLRNKEHSPVPTITYTDLGGGAVALNGGTSYSPDGQQLTFGWACTAPAVCPASAALAGQTDGLVTWQPGAGTYTVALTVTDQDGLSTTTSQQVTVN